MRLVKLATGVAVNPAGVRHVEVGFNRDGVIVIMTNGASHWVPNDYHKTAYETFDRVTKELAGETT